MAALRLSSPAFAHDDPLPARFFADDEGVSPPLQWDGVPPGTLELVLVCDDPDADVGVLTHWVVYGLQPDGRGLPEAVPTAALVDQPVELVQGLNEFDGVGWQGPEFADDRGPHRMFFRLFALDTELDLPAGASRVDLREAAKGHVLATAELVGIA